MAGFLPFISEILPMIMPATTHVATAKDIEAEQPNVRGPVTRREAITGKCDKMCASGMLPSTVALNTTERRLLICC